MNTPLTREELIAHLVATLAAVREAERRLDTTTDAWLDAHQRHTTALQLGGRRALLDAREIARWQECADDAALPAPTECPAWWVQPDASDPDGLLHTALVPLEACRCAQCDHAETIDEIKAELARRKTWPVDIEEELADAEELLDLTHFPHPNTYDLGTHAAFAATPPALARAAEVSVPGQVHHGRLIGAGGGARFDGSRVVAKGGQRSFDPDIPF